MTINRIFNFIQRKIYSLRFSITNFLEKLYCNLICIEIGKGNIFRGFSHIYKAEGSRVVVGNNCTFNSAFCTNHIGLNHPCVIATHTEDAIVRIGDNVGVSSTTINCWTAITIGNNVRIGANCVLMDSDFHLDDPRTPPPSPIIIGNNVWLGANVTVLKGVAIGRNSIVGMNSTVTKSIPENVVAAGTPCKVIRSLTLSEIGEFKHESLYSNK